MRLNKRRKKKAVKKTSIHFMNRLTFKEEKVAKMHTRELDYLYGMSIRLQNAYEAKNGS